MTLSDAIAEFAKEVDRVERQAAADDVDMRFDGDDVVVELRYADPFGQSTSLEELTSAMVTTFGSAGNPCPFISQGWR